MNERDHRTAQWLYQGLWRVLVTWFVVPDHPPDLPVRAGEKIERFRPSISFVRYLKFWFWLGLTVIDGILFVLWIASFFVSIWLGVLLAPVFVAVAILPDIAAYVGIHLRYDTTWYVLGSRSLRIRRGIWIIRETTITYENIQNVKIHQGPVQRYFGFANVIVETAGGGGSQSNKEGQTPSHSHVGLLEGVADAGRIRDLIMDRVRRSRHAGLGDEDIKTEKPYWTPEHVTLLREIRNGLAGLHLPAHEL